MIYIAFRVTSMDGSFWSTRSFIHQITHNSIGTAYPLFSVRWRSSICLSGCYPRYFTYIAINFIKSCQVDHQLSWQVTSVVKCGSMKDASIKWNAPIKYLPDWHRLFYCRKVSSWWYCWLVSSEGANVKSLMLTSLIDLKRD